MKPFRQTIDVRFRYAVHFTTGLFDSDNVLLRTVVEEAGERPAKLLFVVDQGVCRAGADPEEAIRRYCGRHADALELVCPPLILPGGERLKNDARAVEVVHAAICRFGLCRHSFVVAVGGGALLDITGYAAATAHRGVRLIRVPTTVLSQNDSGVGVKNGINAFGRKNFLGTFAPPYAVLNDFAFLRSLSDRDWRSGIAEAVKVALIKDAEFFEYLEDRAAALALREMESIERVIYRCAELHLQHIASSGDPFEMGISRPLDFGHWAAHKLEQMTGFRLRHGEAVAIGIVLDSTYACLTGLLPERDCRRIYDVLARLGFSLSVPELASPSLLAGLAEFREHLGGRLSIPLLAGIGRAIEVHEIDEEMMARAAQLLAAHGRRAPLEGGSHEAYFPDEPPGAHRRVLHRKPEPAA